MLSQADGTAQDRDAVPEIAVIKEILLGDLRHAHEARMERIEERLAVLSRDVGNRLSELEARIAAVAAESGRSQKKALAEISEAISQIAVGLRSGEGAAENVGS